MSEANEATLPGDATGAPGDGAPPPLPPLPTRLLQAIVSPGKMNAAVAENPKWIGAMLVCAALLALSIALLPYELFEEMQRRMTIQSGRPVQEVPENVQTIIRVISIAGAAIGFIVISFFGAAITTFLFAFVLGDEGKYKQYLAIGVHAAVIPTLVAVLLIPMRIAAGDPQLTINLSTFLVFLPDGMIYNTFRAMDISQIWSTLVMAQGIHAIDHRRSYGSAVAIQLAILLVIALIAGWFLTRQGL
jgi:hypothetical protein